MPSNIDFPIRALRLALVAGFAALCAAGCGSLKNDSATQAASVPPAPIPVPAVPAPVAPPRAQVPDALTAALAYADRIRSAAPSELGQEMARLNDSPAPADQLRLAMALVQTRQLYDLVRAQELLQRVLASTDTDALPLHGLARLLAARYAEQRRVEDVLDRQGQQLKDAQRKLDQTNDKLEALKEIERSLSRPNPPGGASATGAAGAAAPSAATRARARASAP
jgi:hypothetical protein